MARYRTEVTPPARVESRYRAGDSRQPRTDAQRERARGVMPRRLRAGDEPGTGTNRYRLIRAAAERIRDAQAAGYFLEATTLIESILAERLEKRAQYLHDHHSQPPAALARLKDGFANLGPLVDALEKHEPEPALREVLGAIRSWAKDRNRSIHAMAKYGEGAREPWATRLASAVGVAERGSAVLVMYDQAERRVSHRDRGRRFAAGTCPDALAPIGQTYCEHCGASSSGSTR